MRRSIPLQKECLPSIYIYIYIQSTKDARYIAHVPVPVHRIGRKHSQFRPKLHVCLCWCRCVGVYCMYMCVSGPNKLHALTRGTHARTHICTHGSLSRSPTPVSCPREKKRLLYTEVGIYMPVYPRLTLYTYMEILKPVKLNTNRQTGRAGPSKLLSSSSLSSLSIVVATCN